MPKPSRTGASVKDFEQLHRSLTMKFRLTPEFGYLLEALSMARKSKGYRWSSKADIIVLAVEEYAKNFKTTNPEIFDLFVSHFNRMKELYKPG